jgi:hypothetical protein
MKPMDAQGDVVGVECEVVSKVPKRVTRPYSMRVKGKQLCFQPESHDDPDQRDLGEELDRKSA